MKEFLINSAVFTVYFFVFFIFGCSILGYTGKNSYIGDILSNFRLQYFIISFILAILFFILYKFNKPIKWALIPLTLCLIINGFELFRWIKPQEQVNNTHSFIIKVALSNVWKVNKNYDRLIGFVKNNEPDILVLQEVNSRWLSKLKDLNGIYSYNKSIPRNDNFGIAVYSKNPINNVKIVHSGKYKKPMILFESTFHNKKILIAAVHPTPPKNKDCFESRNYQLNQVSTWIKNSKSPAIIIGDLNLSMFSPIYKDLIKNTKLINSRKGFGLYLTWPTLLPKVFRIPIDQILHTQNLTTISFKTGSNIGSDHLPVVAVLKLNK